MPVVLSHPVPSDLAWPPQETSTGTQTIHTPPFSSELAFSWNWGDNPATCSHQRPREDPPPARDSDDQPPGCGK